MRENYRNSIASVNKFPQFTIMNVIEGQAGLVIYSSLIFYSLTIDNILNIIVLLILAGISIMMLTGQNGILNRAGEAKETTGTAQTEEQVKLAVNGAITRGLGTVGYDNLKTELDGQFGVGKYTIDSKSSTATIWTVTVNGKIYKIKSTGTLTTVIESANGTEPYLPSSSFSKLEGTSLDDGLVIKDTAGNEYVWIEVPNNRTDGTGPNYTGITNDNYTGIATALQTYAEDYRKGSATQNYDWTDEWYDGNGKSANEDGANLNDTTGCGLTYTEYTNLYHTMLSSVYENGGFWIGRYEAGIPIAEARISASEPINNIVPLSQIDKAPIYYVKCSQAQTLASKVNSGNYTSSLMFGVQWDLVCKYLEGKDGLTTTDINSNSTSWGNYTNSELFTVTRGAYTMFKPWASNDPMVWAEVLESYTRQSMAYPDVGFTLFSTGVTTRNMKQNIYDLAGNVYEFTLEKASGTNGPCAKRGGDYRFYGTGSASYRHSGNTAYSDLNDRFPRFTILRCLKSKIM